ncbi:MAG: type II secretion system F family protein [Acetobacteraceae bacterium]|nr:type II secretion system F family protein [Acetobacteraceae bacterium]
MTFAPDLADPALVRPFAVLAGLVLLLVLLAAWLAERAEFERRLAGRLASLGRTAAARPARRKPAVTASGVLRAIGEAISGTALISEKDRKELERAVAAAGYRPQAVVPVVLGLKVVLLVALPAAAYAVTVWRDVGGMNHVLLVALAVGAAILGPTVVLRHLHRRYVTQLRTGLADALDLMVICSEAGLGLESMVERVAVEMAPSNGAIASEFSTLANELRLLSDRRQALLNLGERTDVEGLRRLGTTLAQTLQYGTPLGQALRTLAAEMRHERLTAFEERAARLPALLVLPLTMFILPCLIVLLAGPSFVQLIGTLGRMGS